MQEPDARPQSSCGEQEPATAVRRWIQATCHSHGVVALCHRHRGADALRRGTPAIARVAAQHPCSWHLPEAGQATGGPCPALEARWLHRHPVAPRNHDSDHARASTPRRYARRRGIRSRVGRRADQVDLRAHSPLITGWEPMSSPAAWQGITPIPAPRPRREKGCGRVTSRRWCMRGGSARPASAAARPVPAAR